MPLLFLRSPPRLGPRLVTTTRSCGGANPSAQLRDLAEEGTFGPLADMLRANPGVCAMANTPPPPPVSRLIGPGATMTLNVEAGGRCRHISVVAMLIPTNDGFIAANAADIPSGQNTTVIMSPAYDSGTEANDELCSSIPGPGFAECVTPSNPQGNGGGARVGNGEGVVHIHAGIHGIGNLVPAMRDWRNPAARIIIRRVN